MRIVSSLEVRDCTVTPSTLDRVADHLKMAVEVNKLKRNIPLEWCDDQVMDDRIISQVIIASDDIVGDSLEGCNQYLFDLSMRTRGVMSLKEEERSSVLANEVLSRR